MNIKARQAIEKRIVRRVIKSVLAAGYYVSLNNGGEEDEYRGNVRKDILKEMFATDDEHLYLFTQQQALDGYKKPSGWVYFVYGNDGWDVICDYTVNLEKVLTEANALAEKLGG